MLSALTGRSRSSAGNDFPETARSIGNSWASGNSSPCPEPTPGFVSVLHIGLNREAGYFYYVMRSPMTNTKARVSVWTIISPRPWGELARLESFQPRSVSKSPLVLTDALGHLHRNGLVHRDIKPSNIIFVNRCPKLADIGLVADISESATFVGTEGYVPPEGPGKPTADLYGLGKVLYQISLGQSLQDFPKLPDKFDQQDDAAQLKKLYQVILMAWDLNVRRRFQSAQEMFDPLRDRRGANKRISRPSGGTLRLPSAQAPLQVAVLCHRTRSRPAPAVAAHRAAGQTERHVLTHATGHQRRPGSWRISPVRRNRMPCPPPG